MNSKLYKHSFVLSILGISIFAAFSSHIFKHYYQYDHTPALWRDHFGAAYDRSKGQIIIFGGNRNGEWLEDAWTGNPGSWSPINGQIPQGRASAVFLYDPVREETLLFGGLSKGGKVWGDFWRWNGYEWLEIEKQGPSPRHSAAAAFDESRQRVVVFSGCGEDDDQLWEWDGHKWEEMHPEGAKPNTLCRSTMAYDPVRKTVILFGGFTRGKSLGDMWEWDGERWKEIDYNSGPSPRNNHILVTNLKEKKILLFGGWNAEEDKILGDTWIWDGRQWKSLPGQSPSPREMPAAVYDTRNNEIIMFGGRGEDGVTRDDLWIFRNSKWQAN